MKVRELIEVIERDGWRLTRTKGSHRQYTHPAKIGPVTVSGHFGDDVPIGTLNNILKQAGIRKTR